MCIKTVTIFATVLFCLLVLFDFSSAQNQKIRKCGHDATMFLKWFCENPSFEFPFEFERVHVVMRYQPPKKQLYPFQHQAAVCCKIGCTEYGFKRLCRYRNEYNKCSKRSHIRTKKGRDARARCLLEVHGPSALHKTISY